MIYTKLTKAQQRKKAAERLEIAAMEVVEIAEDLAASTYSGNRRYHRALLLEKARLYARALDALSRVG